MDESAVKLIQQTAIAANDNRQARMPDGTIALPDNFNIHNLEPYLAQRRRFRGQMLTASIADFVSFVKAEGSKGDGFIDGDTHSAKVFFNLGTKEEPGHGDHVAVLKLKATAAFTALIKADGARFDQRQLIDWLEDWQSNLVAYTQEGEALSMSTAIAAVRVVSIKSSKEQETTQNDFNAARSTLEKVDASSRLGLPAGFRFTCEPYLGLPSRSFQLRLAVITSADKPMLSLRIVRREAEEEAIAEDFKEVLIREIGEAATLTIGTFTP